MATSLSATSIPTGPGTSGTIEISGVSKTYVDRNGVENCVFEGVDLTVRPGEFLSLLGPSGCGKTTLLKMIGGLTSIDEGTITVRDKVVDGPLAECSVVFQSFALLPWSTVIKNVAFGLRLRGVSRAEREARAMELIELVGLTGSEHKYPAQLSGGMQRRAELARAMINNPAIMILDEPFRGLDAMTKELMWEYYSRLFEESRRTNFFVTTDIDEAIFLADRLLIMSNIPCQVRAVLDIDIPRPRTLISMVENDRANEIKMNALSILHEEAMKSFSRGSKAAADFVDAYSKRVVRN